MKRREHESVKGIRILVTLLTMLAVLVASACSDGDTEDRLSAREVCDGTLSPPASAALERLAEDEGFHESTPRTLNGVVRELSRLWKRNNPRQYAEYATLCLLEDTDSIYPALVIEFRWSDVDPRKMSPERGLKPELTYYRIGVRAESSRRYGARLEFACEGPKQPETGAKWIEAHLTVAYRHADPEAQAKDQMLILHSASRRLAAALKCSDANLPASPDLRPISVKEVLKDVR